MFSCFCDGRARFTTVNSLVRSKRGLSAALAVVFLFSGCALRVLEIPAYLVDTPVEADLRREVWRSRRVVRVVPEGHRAAVRSGSFFFPARTEADTEANENGAYRVRFVPDLDRRAAITDAVSWLTEGGAGPVVLAHSDEIGEELTNIPAHVSTVKLSRPKETEATVRQIVAGIAGDAAESGVVIIAGEESPAIAYALLQEEATGIRVIPELFLPNAGRRMRAAEIPVAGALALDLAGAIREVSPRRAPRNDVHVPTVFFRY